MLEAEHFLLPELGQNSVLPWFCLRYSFLADHANPQLSNKFITQPYLSNLGLEE